MNTLTECEEECVEDRRSRVKSARRTGGLATEEGADGKSSGDAATADGAVAWGNKVQENGSRGALPKWLQMAGARQWLLTLVQANGMRGCRGATAQVPGLPARKALQYERPRSSTRPLSIGHGRRHGLRRSFFDGDFGG